MKKLLALIGAVATAFGLYAVSDPNANMFQTSFEPLEDGVSGMVFTPPSGWTWAGDSLTLGTYTSDSYSYTGAGNTRSQTWTTQANYLKLDTGSDTLLHENALTADEVYFDQLVKFTGFEEPQTNLTDNARFAVWMKAIETEGEEGQPGYIAGETNLYVTCGQVGVSSTEQVALQLAGSYAVDTWYRLTVKKINNILAEGARAGFVVYIDGVRVAAVSEDAKSLIDPDVITDEAATLQSAKQLFPSIVASSTVENVGYKGIGAIDDLTYDVNGPEFCQKVNATVTLIPNTVLAITNETTGVEVAYNAVTGAFSVAPGDVVSFYFTAGTGYLMTPVKIADVAVSSTTYDYSSQVTPQQVLVKVSWADGYENAEFATAASALTKVQELEATEAEIEVTAKTNIIKTTISNFGLIALASGAVITITPASSTWAFSVAPALLHADVAAGVTITADADAEFYFDGTVAGTIFAQSITNDTALITLTGDGKIITLTDLPAASFDGEVEVGSETINEVVYKTYTAKGAAPAGGELTIELVGGVTSVTNDGVVTFSAAGDKTVTVYTNGVAITGSNYTIADSYADDVLVVAVATTTRTTVAPGKYWWESPAVVANSTSRQTGDVKMFHGDNKGDFIGASSGMSDGGSQIFLLSDIIAGSADPWQDTADVGGTAGDRAMAISLPLGVAVVGGCDAGCGVRVISLQDPTKSWLIGSDSETIGPGSLGFSTDGKYLYSDEYAGTNTKVAKWAIKGNLRGDAILELVTEWNVGTRIRALKVFNIDGKDIVYCLLDGKSGVSAVDTTTGTVYPLVTSYPQKCNYGSLSVSGCGTSTPHLIVTSGASGEPTCISVYELGATGLTVGENPIAQFDTTAAAALGLTASTYGSDVYGYDDESMVVYADNSGINYITYVSPGLMIKICEGGDKGTVNASAEYVKPGESFTFTIDNVASGFSPIVFFNGTKLTPVEGTYTATAAVDAEAANLVVAYVKDTAWFLNPFVKNHAKIRSVYHGSDLADVALTPNGQSIVAGLDTYNYFSQEGAYDGMYQYSTAELTGYVGAYLGTPENWFLANKNKGYLAGNYEGFRCVIPLTQGIVVGPQQGALGDGVHVHGDNIVFPMGGSWGGVDENGELKVQDDRYFLSLPENDLNNGSVGAFQTYGLQWLIAGVQSTDGQYAYVAFHARNEITKARIGTDSETGKMTLKKTGTFWRTWDVAGVNNGHNATALALYNNGTKDIVYASLADGRLVQLDEETMSGNEYANAKAAQEGEEATVADHKMIELADLSSYGAIRSMKVTGVADGTPHLVVQINATKTLVFALGTDGSLVSATPIADVSAIAAGSAAEFQSVTALDDESALIGNYSNGGYYLAVVTARPAEVTVRGTFGAYEDGVNSNITYGAAAEIAYAAPAGYHLTGVKVNGVADNNFESTGYTFSDAELTRNVYIEMTVERNPVAKIGETTYATLAAAFAAAQANDRIELLDNVAVDDTIATTVATTLDLGGYTLTGAAAGGAILSTTADLVISNGIASVGSMNFVYLADGANVTVDTITVSGTADPIFETVAEGTRTLTIGADAVINVAGNSWCDFRCGTVNIYGTITNAEGGNGAAGWACNGTVVYNIYDGAVLTSGREDFFRNNRGKVTYNIYGGTFNVPHDAVFYSYYKAKNNTEDPTFNIYGGTFESTSLYKTTSGVEEVPAVVTPLDSACKAKFKGNGFGNGKTLADYCAPGYAPVLVDGYYVIQQIKWEVAFYAGEVVSNAQQVVYGNAATNFVYDTTAIDAWTNAAGVAYNFTDVITCSTNFYAKFAAAPVGPTWPAAWDQDEKATYADAFATWAAGVGAKAGEYTAADEDAFLLNVATGTTPDLTIESITVADGVATIVVSADGVDLANINGVLYVDGADDLTSWTTTEIDIATGANIKDGKATFTVDSAKFMKAKIGFKAPTVPAAE